MVITNQLMITDTFQVKNNALLVENTVSNCLLILNLICANFCFSGLFLYRFNPYRLAT